MLVNWGAKPKITQPCNNVITPPPHCQNLTLRYRLFLYLYNRLRSKLLRKGVIQ
ncbi:hypothetical protein [Helicobacter bilis]|nr:hypothetical protein [Helicobacter bilis]